VKLKFFTVPAVDAGDAEREINAFLSSHRILTLDRQLVSDGAGSFWALCVSYLEPGRTSTRQERRSKVDYREVLPPDEFEVFAHLRRKRKELAEKDGVPPYHVFTNEQLAAIVQQRIRSPKKLGSLSGVGPARISKYGQPILDAFGEVAKQLEETSASDAPNDDSSR